MNVSPKIDASILKCVLFFVSWCKRKLSSLSRYNVYVVEQSLRHDSKISAIVGITIDFPRVCQSTSSSWIYRWPNLVFSMRFSSMKSRSFHIPSKMVNFLVENGMASFTRLIQNRIMHKVCIKAYGNWYVWMNESCFHPLWYGKSQPYLTISGGSSAFHKIKRRKTLK